MFKQLFRIWFAKYCLEFNLLTMKPVNEEKKMSKILDFRQ